MGGGVVEGPIPPHGEAGPGFPDTPEYRERIALAAQNLGIVGTQASEGTEGLSVSAIDKTIHDFQARGEDPYDAIEQE